MRIRNVKSHAVLIIVLLGSCLLAGRAWAHCDSLEGPVIQDARAALEAGDPKPVLKWVGKEQEEEILAAFKKTMAVRVQGDDARDLADRFFFETLVRIHRQGEGEAFTGLVPAESVDPAFASADKALQTGSAQELAQHLSAAVNEGIRKRLATALERKKHAADSVEAGREYVAAYVEYIHFVENAHRLVSQGASHAHQEPAPHVH